jgi:hypothetical protein
MNATNTRTFSTTQVLVGKTAPRRPKEGTIWKAHFQNETRLFGGFRLLGAVRQQQHTFSAETRTWVPQGEPTVLPQRYNPLTPGALVRLNLPSRRNAFRHIMPEHSAPEAREFLQALQDHPPSYRGWEGLHRWANNNGGNPERTSPSWYPWNDGDHAVVLACCGTAVLVLHRESSYAAPRTVIVHKSRLERVEHERAVEYFATKIQAQRLEVARERMRLRSQTAPAPTRYCGPATAFSPFKSKEQRRQLRRVGAAIGKAMATPVALDTTYPNVQFNELTNRLRVQVGPLRYSATRSRLEDLSWKALVSAHHRATGVQLVRDVWGEFGPAEDMAQIHSASWSEPRLAAPASVLALRARPAEWSDGETRMTVGNETHEWSDGTVRAWREPAIIGPRRSSKAIVRRCLHKIDNSGPTVGIELEVQAVNISERSAMAYRLRNRLDAAWPTFGQGDVRKYLAFEDDPSTGWRRV